MVRTLGFLHHIMGSQWSKMMIMCGEFLERDKSESRKTGEETSSNIRARGNGGLK